jgi:hypothetical protein
MHLAPAPKGDSFPLVCFAIIVPKSNENKSRAASRCSIDSYDQIVYPGKKVGPKEMVAMRDPPGCKARPVHKDERLGIRD